MAKKTRVRRYWVLKSEPDSYSIDDLKRDGRTGWSGVRNYQARNIMRDEMKVGDLALFHHSSAEPTGVAGVAEIVGPARPDPTALDPENDHYDEKATEENPIWVLVDVGFVAKFKSVVSLESMKKDDRLEGMMLLARGSRLSVQPVSENHFAVVCELGGWKPK
jgi:predicted RNA-binding protein with PUA-like domain